MLVVVVFFFVNILSWDNRIDLEYQEVSEELPARMIQQFDDRSQMLHISPSGQRLSMMHHMPDHESMQFGDFRVRVPGGATEEIIIHTDYAPPTPRLSFLDEHSSLVPVNIVFV